MALVCGWPCTSSKAGPCPPTQALISTPSSTVMPCWRRSLLGRRLGGRLVQATTRRIHLTPEGEAYLLDGARILADLEALERSISGTRATARGPLSIACTLGFGRQRLAPALSAFARAYPEVQVQLQLTDRPVNLVEQGFDAVVRFGALPDSALTA